MPKLSKKLRLLGEEYHHFSERKSKRGGGLAAVHKDSANDIHTQTHTAQPSTTFVQFKGFLTVHRILWVFLFPPSHTLFLKKKVKLASHGILLFPPYNLLAHPLLNLHK